MSLKFFDIRIPGQENDADLVAELRRSPDTRLEIRTLYDQTFD